MTDFNNNDLNNRDVNNRPLVTDRTHNPEVVRRRDRRHGLGWVPWVALLLLLLLGLLFWWMASEANEDETEDTTTTTAAVTTTVAGTATTAAFGTAAVGSAMTAGGVNLLDLASKGSVASAVGQQATVKNLEVLSVVADEGFWVGSGGKQFFVHLSAASRNSGESTPKVTAGSRVDAAGQVVKAPEQASSLGVTTEEGAKQLRDQGAYLEAASYSMK